MISYTTKSPDETIELGKKLVARLRVGDNILLFGDLGVGKTYFTKGIAVGLGIKEVIKSPTYAYVNQFSVLSSRVLEKQSSISNRQSQIELYHYDLYRLSEGDDDLISLTTSITSIGLEETMGDDNAINVVEWADRLGDNLPSKYIAVYFDSDGDSRQIRMQFVSPTIVPKFMISKLYEEWVMPIHIREHCKGVADVAMQIADAYIQKGEIVNKELLYSAAMLHDLHRICDIRDLKKSGFKEDITDVKWSKWLEFRKKYAEMHHSEITSVVLSKMGYSDTAEVIRLHMSKNIILELQSYDSLEKQIMFYSDKRVKHDEIVDLNERFRDGYERYGKFNINEKQDFFEDVKKATFNLEKELFDGLDITPEDIV